jgi:hypothetical protein
MSAAPPKAKTKTGGDGSQTNVNNSKQIAGQGKPVPADVEAEAGTVPPL